MANVIAEARSQIRKKVVEQAIKIGKEAWQEAKRKHNPFAEELKRKSRERWNSVRQEAAETEAYLQARPRRTVVSLVSAVLAASLYGRSQTRKVNNRKKSLLLAGSAASAFVFARSILPLVLTRLINRGLKKSRYKGRVEDVELSLLEGAIGVRGIDVATDASNSGPIPAMYIEKAAARIHWKDLFKRTVVASIDIDKPVVFFAAGSHKPAKPETSSADQKNKNGGEPWNRRLRKFLPMNIEHAAIHDGEVHMRNLPGQNGTDVRLTDINVIARNITNSEKFSPLLRADLHGQARAMSHGKVTLDGRAYPLANQPTFHADLNLKALELNELKGVIREAADIEVTAGHLDFAVEVAAAEGKLDGYAKPVIQGLRMSKLPKGQDGHAVKGAFVRGLTNLLTNKQQDQIATKVNITGRIDAPSIGVISGVKNLFKNAFSQALTAGLEETVSLPTYEPITTKKSTIGAMFSILKEAFSRFGSDGAPRLGASLSYYTAFSLAPLLLLAISIAGLIFGREAAQGRVMDQLGSMMGPQSAAAVQSMIQAAQKPVSGAIATIIGLITLLLGASGVMNELKFALNRIWRVEGKSGLGGLIKDKLLSVGMVLVIGFLLLVSLALSAGLAALGTVLGNALPVPEAVLHVLNFVISFGVIMLLFAAIFKALPDAKIKWHDVWVGAAITSLFFTIGKFLLGMYIGKGTVGSSYGAAGSVLVMLLWIYYSAQILYFGAEFTKIFAERYGSGVKPSTADLPEKIRY